MLYVISEKKNWLPENDGHANSSENLGYLPFSWENRTFRLENQMTGFWPFRLGGFRKYGL